MIPSRDGGRGTGIPQKRLHFSWENIQQKEPKEHTDKKVLSARYKWYYERTWYTRINRCKKKGSKGTIGTQSTNGTIGTFILTNNI